MNITPGYWYTRLKSDPTQHAIVFVFNMVRNSPQELENREFYGDIPATEQELMVAVMNEAESYPLNAFDFIKPVPAPSEGE